MEQILGAKFIVAWLGILLHFTEYFGREPEDWQATNENPNVSPSNRNSCSGWEPECGEDVKFLAVDLVDEHALALNPWRRWCDPRVFHIVSKYTKRPAHPLQPIYPSEPLPPVLTYSIR
ncbi:hypothetical protein I7I51_00005 [Histoplasma capsulatum]|uniref:Uncharacterized protein n=1 Tax=Ajellomyces capsulatus TaxID=5037 RepID=A0A8A1MCL9_AJECA|nr:hypothetical protein I7I51_00005 [Histoplasma capsulatum]